VLLSYDLSGGAAIDHVAVMHLGELVVIFAVAFVVAFVFPLVVLLDAQDIKVLLQHAAILELVVGSSLVVRARLF
jgi:hypothetical protein